MTVEPQAIKQELRNFAKSLGSIIQDRHKRQTLLAQANYDGVALLALLRAEALTATPQDISLVNSEVALFVQKGIQGEVTQESFNAYMKDYRAAVRNQHPASRPNAGAVVQMMANLMHRDPSVRKEYNLLRIARNPGADDINAHMALIDGMLRGVKVEQQIDDLSTGRANNQSALATPVVGSKLTHTQNSELNRAIETNDSKGILAVLLPAGVDPVKDLKLKRTKDRKTKSTGPPKSDVPRDKDGKVIKWVKGKMEPCECGGAGAPGGVNDNGEHLYRDCTLKDRKARQAAKAAAAGGSTHQTSCAVDFDEALTEEEMGDKITQFFERLEGLQQSSLVTSSDHDLAPNHESDDDDDCELLDGRALEFEYASDDDPAASIAARLGLSATDAAKIMGTLRSPDHVAFGPPRSPSSPAPTPRLKQSALDVHDLLEASGGGNYEAQDERDQRIWGNYEAQDEHDPTDLTRDLRDIPSPPSARTSTTRPPPLHRLRPPAVRSPSHSCPPATTTRATSAARVTPPT